MMTSEPNEISTPPGSEPLARAAPARTPAQPRSRCAPRRVLYVDHTALLGGGEIALLNLVKHLDPSRYEPVIVLFSDGPLREKLIEAGVETHVVAARSSVVNARKDGLGGKSLLRLRDIVATLAFIIRLKSFIRRAQVEVVHTNSLKADIIGGLAGRLAGKWVLWHVRDRIADDYLPARVARVFRLLARFLPHLVVANSNATLRTLWLTTSRRGAAIPSGISTPHENGPASERLRVVHDGMAPAVTGSASQAVGGAPQPPLIGIVGRISPWKGQDIFLRAAAIVRERFPSARFQIIGAALFGEEDYGRTLHALAEELRLTKTVEFTGFRKDVLHLISGLDVLVHGSTIGEPFGQVVIEGMAASKPVVATNGGGIPEIVLDGVTGLLVPMGDAAAMAAAIEQLIANPEVAVEMGRRGARRVREQFTIELTAAKVQALYDQMLDGPPHAVETEEPSNAASGTEAEGFASPTLPRAGTT